ncbi:hypothetical protein V2J09_017299, partial [Rumex salicifolius]
IFKKKRPISPNKRNTSLSPYKFAFLSETEKPLLLNAHPSSSLPLIIQRIESRTLLLMASIQSQAASLELIRVTKIEGKGRALIASQPLKAGQILLRDSPILIYSAFSLKQQQGSNSSAFQYCANCFRNLAQGGTCALCSDGGDTVFCSAKCQSVALASTHTPWVCQALKYLRNCTALVDHQSDECHVQARYLVAAYNLAMVSPSSFQTLLSLDSGGPTSSDGESSAAMFLHSIISSLPFPEGVSAPSIELTTALLAKDKCNAFGLMEPFSENKERSVRAYAIYPNASFFNHDCLPNACRFDYLDSTADGNTDIIVRMIHDVPQGREICLSYFPVNLRYSERQKRLLNDYGFACTCDRCKVEANWSDKEDEDEDEDDEAMEEEDEEGDDQMMGGSDEDRNEIVVDDDNDFPHAYFFLRYMCSKENCGGTLAPVPPASGSPSNIMECNMCGTLKNEENEADRNAISLPLVSIASHIFIAMVHMWSDSFLESGFDFAASVHQDPPVQINIVYH